MIRKTKGRADWHQVTHKATHSIALVSCVVAAALVGGQVIWPNFEDEEFTGTDFNDYVNAGGEI